TRSTGGEQLASGGAIQTGVADDGRILRFEGAARRRHDDEFAARHALADVVVGFTGQMHVQATGIPHAPALADGTGQTQVDGRIDHALVAVAFGDLAGQTRTNGAVVVLHLVIEDAAGLVFDG